MAGNPRKRANAPALSEIKTEELFLANFEGYSIDKTDGFILTSWGSQSQRAKINNWLKGIGSRYATGLNKISRNSEYSLHSLILDVILPVLELSDFSVKSKVEPDMSDEAIELVSRRIAHNQSRSTSRTTGIPLDLDTTDATAVAMFIDEIVKQMKACDAYANKGRVEITISEKESQVIRCLVEAKLAVAADQKAGFFQNAAEMVVASEHQRMNERKPVYGVYTDYQTWQFLVLKDRVIKHSAPFQLLRTSTSQFDEEVIDIVCYLFEIFDIPAETDLVATAHKVAETLKKQGEFITAKL